MSIHGLFFSEKKIFFLHACATCSGLPCYISTMVAAVCPNIEFWSNLPPSKIFSIQINCVPCIYLTRMVVRIRILLLRKSGSGYYCLENTDPIFEKNVDSDPTLTRIKICNILEGKNLLQNVQEVFSIFI